MNTLLLVIIAILLPPLAVGLKDGIGFHLFLNIILTLLVWLPGMVHALWVVLKGLRTDENVRSPFRRSRYW